jgi:hypothetical protein
VAIERRYTVTETAGGDAAAVGAWLPWSTARIVNGPGRPVCQPAAKEPSGAARTTATGVQLAPGVAASWSISIASPALPPGTLPVTDTPLRTNAEALATNVMPPLVALTETLPWRTTGVVPGLIPAPPDPPDPPEADPAAPPGPPEADPAAPPGPPEANSAAPPDPPEANPAARERAGTESAPAPATINEIA